MRASTSAVLVAVTLALAAPAAQAIYKCAGTNGPIYQDDPCPAGKELRNFDTDPPNLSIVPGQSGAATPRDTAVRERPAPSEPKSAKNGNGKQTKLRGDPAERRHVRVGMSEGELLMRLGTPDVTSGNRQKQNLRWTWLPVDGDADTITTVTLVNGSVANVERKVVRK